MRKFLLKFFYFSAFVFAIAFVFWAFKKNPIQSNPYITEKIKYLEEKKNYNLLFIGSSKINNQINPQIIDSLLPQINSYNLGANASFNLENFQTIEEVISKSELPTKYIVLELQKKIDFSRNNLSSEKSFAPMDPENFIFASRYHLEERNYRQIGYTLYSTLFSILYLQQGMTNQVNSGMYNKYIEKNGFVPLDEDIAVQGRHIELLKNPLIIEDRKLNYLNDNKVYLENSIFTKKLKSIQTLCKMKGIKLILLLPPPAESNAKVLLKYATLQGIPTINFLDPNENKEFYLLENRFDAGHLNNKGANLFSKKLALKLKNFIN
jgi:hypothetical protein